MADDISDEELTKQVVKKLETAEKYRKMNEILDKSAENLEEFEAAFGDEDQISLLKQKINKPNNEK